jgi:pimeloyl-ACP methyl ester carboxylesterase
MKITTFVMLLAMFLSACAPAATPQPTAIPTPTVPPIPVTIPGPDPMASVKPITVDVSGHTMRIFCLGTGSPTIVLESGLGAYHWYWSNVYKGIPPDMRVCAYDRSGSSHTSQQYVEDLHALLTGAKLEGPYVLVGHSYGGLNVILYAHEYPEDVAGILLEDIAVPDQDTRFLAALPPESPEDSQDLKDTREWLGIPHHDVQGVDWTTSLDQVRAVKSLGDIPLIVLTAAAPDADWGNIPAEVQEKIDQIDQATQKELTGLSTNSTQIIATTNQHIIHNYEPQLVIDAIIKLVKQARSE